MIYLILLKNQKKLKKWEKLIRMFLKKRRKKSVDIEKKADYYRDTVFIQNICNLLWESILSLNEARSAQAYLCKELDQVKSIQQREQANSRACITGEVATAMLDLSDHLVRIKLAASKTQSLDIILNGMDMVLKEMEKALTALQIEKISPIGELFNPHHHEFGGIQHLPELEENRVVEVIRDGFRCGDRWIRHPIVVVNQHLDEKRE
jgi:molecular chaperone GrpE